MILAMQYMTSAQAAEINFHRTAQRWIHSAPRSRGTDSRTRRAERCVPPLPVGTNDSGGIKEGSPQGRKKSAFPHRGKVPSVARRKRGAPHYRICLSARSTPLSPLRGTFSQGRRLMLPFPLGFLRNHSSGINPPGSFVPTQMKQMKRTNIVKCVAYKCSICYNIG